MAFANTPRTVVSCQAVLLHKVGKREMKLGSGMFTVYTNKAPEGSILKNTLVVHSLRAQALQLVCLGMNLGLERSLLCDLQQIH